MEKQNTLKTWINRWQKTKATSPPVSGTLGKGQRNEQRAKVHLEQQGLTCIWQNYRCKMGEIDLIMKHDQSLVFVEVRNRKNNRYGSPLETVDIRKQKKLIKTALYFIASEGVSARTPLRFDVVGITDSETGPPHWVQNAFYATESHH